MPRSRTGPEEVPLQCLSDWSHRLETMYCKTGFLHASYCPVFCVNDKFVNNYKHSKFMPIFLSFIIKLEKGRRQSIDGMPPPP